MMFVNNSDDLRRYMPNALKEAAGEKTLFQKLEPWISAAEVFLVEEIISPDFCDGRELPSDVANWAQHFVASKAMADALPSIDLVLTPNGFGIVSNQNMAPASKERVQALADSLRQSAESAANGLLRVLMRLEDWTRSSRGRRFASMLLYRPWEVSRSMTLDQYLESAGAIYGIEQRIARNVISLELWELLRSAPSKKLSAEFLTLRFQAAALASAVFLQKGEKEVAELECSIIEMLRSAPETFAIWHSSPTAQLWNLKSFENKKTSHGYFF